MCGEACRSAFVAEAVDGCHGKRNSVKGAVSDVDGQTAGVYIGGDEVAGRGDIGYGRWRSIDIVAHILAAHIVGCSRPVEPVTVRSFAFM